MTLLRRFLQRHRAMLLATALLSAAGAGITMALLAHINDLVANGVSGDDLHPLASGVGWLAALLVTGGLSQGLLDRLVFGITPHTAGRAAPPAAYTFPIGEGMNKNLTIKMRNCNHRKYIPHLIELTRSSVIDPSDVPTQIGPFRTRSKPSRPSTCGSLAGSR